ncbi:MAG: FHA domain-containing protein [Polyangiaceae bacterium]|nr:FHA domain-containing protein [Polyangiaceae bacterium]
MRSAVNNGDDDPRRVTLRHGSPARDTAVSSPWFAVDAPAEAIDAEIAEEPARVPRSFDLGAAVREADAAAERKISDVVQTSGPTAAATEPAPKHPAPNDDSDCANDADASLTSRRGESALPREGELLGSYRVIGHYRSGGIAHLYKVAHQNTGEIYLLKALHVEYRKDETHRARTRSEGKLLMSCSTSSYLPRVYEVSEHPVYGPYFVMELLRGMTLDEYIANEHAAGRKISVSAAVETALTLCEALSGMHQIGAIHRDVKPDNVFVLKREIGTTELRLLDWGLAQHATFPKSTHLPPMGTPWYVAPEQVTRQFAITGAVDQYAVILILLELLGAHPVKALTADRKAAVLAQINNEVPPAPAHLVPRELDAICRRGLRKNPLDRYSSMGELSRVLRAFLASDWKLAEPPSEQVIARTMTVLTQKAMEHAPTFQGRAPTPEMPAVPPLKARRVPLEEVCHKPTALVVAPAKLRGHRYELNPEGIIGRHPAYANLVIDDETVSTAHVELHQVNFEVDEPVYSVEALTEHNPPFIGPDKINPLGTWRAGQRLELGHAELILIPAGKVSPDLETHTPLRDLLPTTFEQAHGVGRSAPAPRKQRRKIDLGAWSKQPTLIVLEPEHLTGQRFELGTESIIGRPPDEGFPVLADILIEDRAVSLDHARLTLVTSAVAAGERVAFEIVDLKSTNGLFLLEDGGRRVKIERACIHDFCRVRIGGPIVTIAPPGRGRRNGDTIDWDYLPAQSSPPANADGRAVAPKQPGSKREPIEAFFDRPENAEKVAIAAPYEGTSLLIVEPEEIVARYKLTQQGAVVGSDKAYASLVIGQPSVSDKHATITFDDAEGIRVRDDGSQHGTFVRSGPQMKWRRLSSGEQVRLFKFSSIRLGSVRVVLCPGGRADTMGRWVLPKEDSPARLRRDREQWNRLEQLAKDEPDAFRQKLRELHRGIRALAPVTETRGSRLQKLWPILVALLIITIVGVIATYLVAQHWARQP